MGRIGQAMRSDYAVALGFAILALALNYALFIDGFLGGFSELELHEADQLSYASLARSVVRGEGLVDRCIYPVSLSRVKTFPHPYLRGTLFPLMVVPFFAVFGVSDIAAIIPVWLFYGAMVFMTYLLSKKFLSRNWSLVVTALVALNPVVVRLSIRSLPDLPVAVFLATILWLIQKKARPLTLGCVYGLAYYVKPTFMFFVPVILFGLGYESSWKERLKSWGLFFLGAFLLLWPWMIRNMLVSGSPFYNFLNVDILNHTSTFADENVVRRVNIPSPIGWALAHPGEMLAKVKTVTIYLFTICRPPALWVLFSSIPLSFLVSSTDKRSSHRRWILVGTVVCGIAPLMVTHVEPRYLVPVLAPLLILTVRMLVGGMEARGYRGALATGASGLVLAVYLVLSVVGLMRLGDFYYGQDWIDWPTVEYMKKRVGSDQVIVGEAAHAISWRCDRTAVFMPAGIEDLKAIDDICSVDFLYFRDPALSRSLRAFENDPSFNQTYSILKEFSTDTKARIYRKRNGRISIQKTNQLLRVGDKFFVKQGGCIFHVVDGALASTPVCVLPEGTVRVRENRETGGFWALTDAMEIVGLAGAESFRYDKPGSGVAVDFSMTATGKGCHLLMDDGQVQAFGDAVPLVVGKQVEDPIRLEVTGTGKGCVVLSSEGAVAAAGDAVLGYERHFGQPIAFDIEFAPGSNDYYILDGYGSTHPSSTEQKLIMGPYDSSRKWAMDLTIMDTGEAYVLTDRGEIINYSVTDPE